MKLFSHRVMYTSMKFYTHHTPCIVQIFSALMGQYQSYLSGHRCRTSMESWQFTKKHCIEKIISNSISVECTLCVYTIVQNRLLEFIINVFNVVDNRLKPRSIMCIKKHQPHGISKRRHTTYMRCDTPVIFILQYITFMFYPRMLARKLMLFTL